MIVDTAGWWMPRVAEKDVSLNGVEECMQLINPSCLALWEGVHVFKY